MVCVSITRRLSLPRQRCCPDQPVPGYPCINARRVNPRYSYHRLIDLHLLSAFTIVVGFILGTDYLKSPRFDTSRISHGNISSEQIFRIEPGSPTWTMAGECLTGEVRKKGGNALYTMPHAKLTYSGSACFHLYRRLFASSLFVGETRQFFNYISSLSPLISPLCQRVGRNSYPPSPDSGSD
jgi:hypothetical protein